MDKKFYLFEYYQCYQRHKFWYIFSPFVTLAINRPDITDTEMETVMDTIVDSLFCFFVTLGKFSNLRGYFFKINYLATSFNLLQDPLVWISVLSIFGIKYTFCTV